MKKIAVILLVIITISTFAANKKVDKATEAKVKAMAVNQKLEFIENKGQFTTTEGKPADNVLFKASYGSCDIYITDKGLSYVFYKIEEKETDHNSAKINKSGSSPLRRGGGEVRGAGGEVNEGEGEVNDTNRKVSYYRLDMDLVGASILKDNIIKEEESKQGHYNYFYPHCPEGIYNVKAYGKITIKNIYKGIDWVIYTNKNNKEQPLKYDFIVHPEANYNDIKIKYINADSLSLLDNNTKLKIKTIAGTIEEGNIYTYQNNKEEVKSKYIYNNDSTISFSINDYDKTQDLVIDPIVWATYYCTHYAQFSDGFSTITTDNMDNVYVTGLATSLYFPTQQLAGAYWLATGSGLFILKFNHNCIRMWATFYGGGNNISKQSICVDSQDNIYITASTSGTTLPTQQLTGAYWQANNASANSAMSDIFILKFNSLGVRQWATYYGGDSSDYSNAICIDNLDNVYITGYTQSSNFPILQYPGAYWQPNKMGVHGNNNIYILKFNSNCVHQWATYYSGSHGQCAYAICSDSQNNIYITGYAFPTSNFPLQQLAGAYWQPINYGNNSNIIILKFNSLGVRQWATFYGGNMWDRANSICVDSQDNIYLTGVTESLNFPTQQLAGAYWQPTNISTTPYTTFILKFNNQGVRQWATFYGGSNNDEATSICADKLDNIYITGETNSSNFPLQQSPGEYWQPLNQNWNWVSFILKFNNQDIRQWGTYYGTHNFWGRGIAVDNQNSPYIIGWAGDSGAYLVNPGNGAYFYNGTPNMDRNYILKLGLCNNQKPTLVITNRNNLCSNDNGFITLSSYGGEGDSLKWYSSGCGQNYIGYDSVITIPSPTQTTTYYARWESSCDTSACDSVTVNVLPIATTNLNPIICQGQSYQVGIHSYSTTGLYIDTLIAANGCDSIINTNLIVGQIKHITLNPNICQGEFYNVGIHNYNSTGVYKDTLSTYLGCDSIITTNLTVASIPFLNLGNDTTLCLGNILVLNVNSQNYLYLWQDNSTMPTYNVSQQGLYWVNILDPITNCSTRDSIYIEFQRCPSPDVYIPNAFTPNGDGLNDFFKIETIAEFKEFKMYIYDRWGELLFESDDKNYGWDGTYKGKPVQKGVYVYLVIGTIKDTNEQIKRSGSVTVLK